MSGTPIGTWGYTHEAGLICIVLRTVGLLRPRQYMHDIWFPLGRVENTGPGGWFPAGEKITLNEKLGDEGYAVSEI